MPPVGYRRPRDIKPTARGGDRHEHERTDPLGPAGHLPHQRQAPRRRSPLRERGGRRRRQSLHDHRRGVCPGQRHRARTRLLRDAAGRPGGGCRLHPAAQLAASPLDPSRPGGRQARPLREALHAPPGASGRGLGCRRGRRPGAHGSLHVAPHAAGGPPRGAPAAHRRAGGRAVHLQPPSARRCRHPRQRGRWRVARSWTWAATA